ncbi:Hypothetical predicted protein [Cloeon dipterum]|uniref:Uncharacterized protein n=1 Tax=Cloeon dipterum TaxID=197152 RepID=A0A8S1E445_9INSE|nr:Hypothetical predicted protein [Cloeon dipterum]
MAPPRSVTGQRVSQQSDFCYIVSSLRSLARILYHDKGQQQLSVSPLLRLLPTLTGHTSHRLTIAWFLSAMVTFGDANRDLRQKRAEGRDGCSDGSLSQPPAHAADAFQDRMDLAAAIADNPQFRGFYAMRRELHPLGLARRLVATSSFAASIHPIAASRPSRAESDGDAGLVEAPCTSGADEVAAASSGQSRKRAFPSSHAPESEPLSKQLKEDRLRRQQQCSAYRRFASVRKQLF